eukprot:5099541-Amphidinium_carterae.1
MTHTLRTKCHDLQHYLSNSSPDSSNSFLQRVSPVFNLRGCASKTSRIGDSSSQTVRFKTAIASH